MSPDAPFVFVVDDDIRVREGFSSLLQSVGYRVAVFATASEFLDFKRPDCPSCLLLDLDLPDVNGLAVQKRLSENHNPSIVFVTGHGDIRSSVQAIKSGAVEFLVKPVTRTMLLPVIEEAILRDRSAREARLEISELRKRYKELSPRSVRSFPLWWPGSRTRIRLRNSETANSRLAYNAGK